MNWSRDKITNCKNVPDESVKRSVFRPTWSLQWVHPEFALLVDRRYRDIGGRCFIVFVAAAAGRCKLLLVL